jgi:MSHA biogenesis protein MshI
VHPDRLQLAQVHRVGPGRPKVRLFADIPVSASPLAALQELRRTYRLERFRVSTVLGAGEYQIHLVEAPAVPPAEVRTAVRWRIKDLLDYPADEATVDVLPLPGDGGIGRPRNVFAVSARNDCISGRMRLFAEAKVPLSIIDIPELGQRNVAALFEEPGRGLALLAIGERGSMLTVTLSGELYLARSLDITSAEIASAAGEGRIALLDRAVLELQRSLDHFDRLFGGLPVGRLLITPGPESEGIRAHFAENLYMPVEILDLASVLDLDAVPALRGPDGQTAALPILGAALRDDTPEGNAA